MSKTYTLADQKLFLKKLRVNEGNLRKTCKQTGITPTAVAKWRQKSPWFVEELNEVIKEIFDDLEELAVRKARKKLTALKFMLTNHPEGKRRGYGAKAVIEADVPSWTEVMRKAGQGL